MILANDTSVRAGWITGYPPTGGSGWTGMDAVMAREGGWDLEIQTFGIAVHDWPRQTELHIGDKPISPAQYTAIASQGYAVRTYTTDKPQYDKDGFSHLLERAVSGDKLSIKALYLMVYNDPDRYSEWRETVDSLQKMYVLT